MFINIIYSKGAKKYLCRQNKDTQKRIIEAIEKIPNGDIKRLKGTQGYRLRVGNIRLIYFKEDNIINIIDIKNRGQAY